MANQDQEVKLPSDYLGILKRRRSTAALTAVLVFGALASYAFLSTPVYRASALVDIERVSDGVPNLNGYQPPDEDYLATQAKLIVSETALERGYQELRLAESPEFASGLTALRKAVSVLALPRTRLVHVNAESTDPKTAAAIANTLTKNFVRQNLDNQLFMPKDVLAALRTRAAGPDAQKIYESLPAVINNPLIQDVKGQILKGELALADLRTRYTPDHPAVKAVEHQLRLMRQMRDRELDNVVRSVTTALSGQLRPNNVRVVDFAKPPLTPARPRRALALALGVLGGLGLGLLAALAHESLDQTVRTHHDVERKLGLSMLGHIPRARQRRGEKIYNHLVSGRESVSGDAFRDLRTMVAIARQGAEDPFLLVTSAKKDEGKTFVATNLAVSLSQLGGRVLIIDGDLRSRSKPGGLGEAGSPGLTEFLSGRVTDVSQLAQRTDIPNLDVVTAGERPTNASELLNSRQLADLVAWARDRYDRVIVDCPPVLAGGDVLLWGRHVSSSILVSRWGRTSLPQAQQARDRLRVGGIDVLGGVLNGAA